MANAAAAVTTHTIAGETFRASARTAAHLTWTIEELKRLHPGARLVILQPCFNTGVAASAGTHDKDAVLDFKIIGLDWWPAQRFFRTCGWAAWFRHQGTWAAESAWHIHAISLGYVAPVGEFVPGQVVDYYAHAFGLRDLHRPGSDDSWFPPDIKATVFSYSDHLARIAASSKADDATMLDLTEALKAFAARTTNPRARISYTLARKILGSLVTSADHVRVPSTVAGTVAILEAKRQLVGAGVTKTRLLSALILLRPLA